MGHLLSAVLVAASSNVDNLGVGFAYGLRGRGLRLGHAWLIALLSGTGTLLSMAAGEWLNDLLSEESGNLIGSALMILIGLHGVVHALRGASTGPPRIEREATTSGEAAILAVSLSLNNLGIGLGAGVSHVGVAATTALTTVGSLVAIIGGRRLGERASTAISRRALGLTGGLLLVVVGIYEFFV